MLQLRSLFIFICLALTNIAQAQEANQVRHLFEDSQFRAELNLTINEIPELCLPFRTAWEEVYKTSKPLSEENVELEPHFPHVNFLSPQVGIDKIGHEIIDIDEDGTDEILYYVARHGRGTYVSTRYYLYTSVSEFESEVLRKTLPDEEDIKTPYKPYPYEGFEEGKDNQLANYFYIKSGVLFTYKGELFAQSGDTRKKGRVSLDRLSKGNSPDPVCKLNLNEPKIKSAHTAPRLPALWEMMGGPAGGMCYGMGGSRDRHFGWNPRLTYLDFQKTLHRPWSIPEINQPINERKDRVREFRFIAWGLQDPISFEIVKQLKSQYRPYVEGLTDHYISNFSIAPKDAAFIAEKSYRYLLDELFYAESSGPRASLPHAHNVNPATSLNDIAKTSFSSGHKIISPNSFRLGLLTDVDTDVLKQFYERMRQLPYWTDEKRSELLLGTSLLSSLSRPDMIEAFIQDGADPDYKSNYFEKTPLMYAAQMNNLKAVETLLKSGADPNRKTHSKSGLCLTPLKRDSRTALMYAAENADSDLIEALIEAGADINATDTLGNSPIWYLDKNETLNEKQKRTILSHFEPSIP